jgi:hypothetical protein
MPPLAELVDQLKALRDDLASRQAAESSDPLDVLIQVAGQRRLQEIGANSFPVR